MASGSRVFVSYSHSDAKSFALDVAAWLRDKGYVPVVDVEGGVPLGTQFDVRLEVEIRASAALVAVLSPDSLRETSFCRNELLFAQAHQKPIVPVRLADVVPPIQIISLSRIDAFADREAALRRLPGAIDEVLRAGQSQRENWKGQDGIRPWWATDTALSFEEELARYGDTFVGRDWLFMELSTWIKSPKSRVLLLTADPGVGKSAIVAQLSTKLNVRGVHFCTRALSASCRAGEWLRTLVYQLAAADPAYRQRIEGLPEPDWSKPKACMRQLILDPLRGRTDLGGPDGPWVFVIDGLDESLAVAGRGLLSLLSETADRLPGGIRIIATSRNEARVLAELQIDGVRRLHLAAEQTDNATDVRTYVTRRMPGPLAERVLTAAAGNFLIARMTLNALQDDDPSKRLSPAALGAIACDLCGLYYKMFRWRFRSVERYQADLLPLLQCLVAARAPLPEAKLAAAVGGDAPKAHGALLDLSQFLVGGSTGRALFHKSIADWLTLSEFSAEYYADATAGHRRLANACWAEYLDHPLKLEGYDGAHLCAHLLAAGRWADALRVVTDGSAHWPQLRAALRELGSKYGEWPEGFRRALETSPHIRAALFRGDTCDMEQRFGDAAAIFRDLASKTTLADGQDYCTVRVRLATTYDRWEKPAEALQILEELVNAPDAERLWSDSYYWATYQQGVALVRLKRYDDATEVLRPLLTWPPNLKYATSALHQLGVIDLEEGRLAEAEAKFREAMPRRGYDHRRAFEHRRLGQICALTGRIDEARKHFEEALRISEDSSNERYAAKTREDIRTFLPTPS